MKSLVSVLLIIIIVSGRVVAQTKVNAADIIAQVNRGEAVTYKNAEITGNLDLTQLANKKLKKFTDEDDERSTKEYISTVTAPLTFSNCTFTGKVLAYYNPDQGIMYFNNNDKKNEIYNTHFDKAVRFENCTFEQQAAFKYSQFKEGISFAGSQFKDEAFFKYTKFQQAPDFSKVKFNDGAIFKYVHFPAGTNFSQAVFTEEADFKYAKFPENTNFEKAQFNGLANFKYANFSDDVKLQGIAFNGTKDFKYTQLGGRKFSEVVPGEQNK